MPPSPSGRVYKTTPAQRAKAAAWRKANPEKSLAYGRAQTIRIRDSFIGPRRPRGRQRTEGPTSAQRAQAARVAQQRRTPAERSESARKGQQTRAAAFVGPPTPAAIKAEKKLAYHREARAAFQASFVGPRRRPGRPASGLDHADPTPEAIQTAQRRAKMVERQRAKTARFKVLFVGPPKPPKVLKVRLPRVVVPKPPKVSKVHLDRAEQAAQRELDRAGRAWDRQAVTLVRRASKVVLRPPMATPKPRSHRTLRAPEIYTPCKTQPTAPAIFGPPAPPRAILRETMRKEVAQAKATETAGKSWDREAVKLIRKTARYIREQVREAAQIAAKAVTPERRAASKAAYEAAMAAWDADVRRIADETRNAFRRRVDAEDERAKRSAAAALEAQSLLSSTVMRGPVRRTPLLRS